jgi:trimethylamine--corrinoid protein Co-methyltransferase
LARHIGLPWRSSNATAANVPDAQAAYESQMSLWGALMGGCNFILHAAGWLESGLTTSYEKFILDIEMLQMFAELFQPGDSPYTPLISDGRSFATWSADGAKSATIRAHGIWKDLLRDYVAPVRDQAISEELDAFVARRTVEGGAPPVS